VSRWKIALAVGVLALAVAVPASAVTDADPAPADSGLGFFDPECMPEIPDEILEELNAEAEELAAFLDEHGIEYTLESGPGGVTWVEWDFADPEAARLVAEFFEDRHGEWIEGEVIELPDFEFPMPLLDLGMTPGLPVTAEEVDEMSALAGDLAAFLDERGISYEEQQVRVVTVDPEDEEALEAVGEFLAEQGPGWAEMEFLPGFPDGFPFEGEFLPEWLPHDDLEWPDEGWLEEFDLEWPEGEWHEHEFDPDECGEGHFPFPGGWVPGAGELEFEWPGGHLDPDWAGGEFPFPGDWSPEEWGLDLPWCGHFDRVEG
jgi:hypothetical protein